MGQPAHVTKPKDLTVTAISQLVTKFHHSVFLRMSTMRDGVFDIS